MKKLSLILAFAACATVLSAQTKGIPRTPEGKPNFSGTYEWPKALSGIARH